MRPNPRQHPTPVKHCRACGTQLERKRFGKRLESITAFNRRQGCGQSCGNTVTRDLAYLTDRSTIDAAGCWIWDLSLNDDGYGQAHKQDGSKLGAHRLAYEIQNGPIPEGMTVDHRCFRPPCVNPRHLRLLSEEANRANQRSSFKTHCINGHEYTPDNTYLRPSGGNRDCRACIRSRVRRYQTKNRASA